MTKVKVFVYGRRQQRRLGYDNSSLDFRHGELKRAITNGEVNQAQQNSHLMCTTLR